MNKPRVFGGHKSTLVYSNNIWFVLVGSKMIVSRHWNYLEVERFGVF